MKLLFLSLAFILAAWPSAPAQARVVVDKSAFTLRVFAHDGEQLARFPVAHGRRGSATPSGSFRITREVKDPAWLSPAGKVIPGGSPRNPLRRYWFTLDAPADPPGSIGIHGTSRPESMGKRESHGCVRIRPADAVRLARLVDPGERVVIQP